MAIKKNQDNVERIEINQKYFKTWKPCIKKDLKLKNSDKLAIKRILNW